MTQQISLTWDSLRPYGLQIGGHTATFFERDDGTLLKLVKPGETHFWTSILPALPSVPDFMPVCHGIGVLPPRDGVDKAPRGFVLLQNVVGDMKLPNIIDIKLGTRSYSLHDTPEKQAYQHAKDLESTSNAHGLRLVACKGPGFSLGKEVSKYSIEQLSQTVSAFLGQLPALQRAQLLGELERIAAWLAACPFEFIGSSVLLSYDAHSQARGVRVNFIDFGHVEAASGAPNAGNIQGIRTLQRVVEQQPPAASAQ